MAYDFANSPTVGQIITGPNGIQYQWDGVKWLAAGSLGSTPFAPAGAINDVGRNLIHNPLFNVAQRGNGPFTVTAVFSLDRWQISHVGSDTMSISQAALSDADRTGTGDEAARYALSNNFTGSATAGSYQYIQQNIEDVRRLSGKTVTVSFYANASTALKLGINILQSFGTGGSPSGAAWALTTGMSVNIPGSAFARYSVTIAIPSASGKTLGTNGDSSTGLAFWYSSASGTGAALSGNVGVQSGIVNLWGIQCEIGTVATPLEKPDPQQDLAKCQRFYYAPGAMIAINGYSGGAGQNIALPLTFPVVMHHAPMINFQQGTASGNISSVSPSNVTSAGFSPTLLIPSGGPGYAYWTGGFTASADL